MNVLLDLCRAASHRNGQLVPALQEARSRSSLAGQSNNFSKNAVTRRKCDRSLSLHFEGCNATLCIQPAYDYIIHWMA
ncbi:hypothetical protein D3C75_793190 [compost metagenome]